MTGRPRANQVAGGHKAAASISVPHADIRGSSTITGERRKSRASDLVHMFLYRYGHGLNPAAPALTWAQFRESTGGAGHGSATFLQSGTVRRLATSPRYCSTAVPECIRCHLSSRTVGCAASLPSPQTGPPASVTGAMRCTVIQRRVQTTRPPPGRPGCARNRAGSAGPAPKLHPASADVSWRLFELDIEIAMV